MKHWGLVFLLLIFSDILFAQVTVSGTISETDSGESLPYAHVIGSNKVIAISDVHGFYSIQVPADTPTTITVRCIGYLVKTIEFKVNADSVLNLKLSPDVQTLSEVVITGDSARSIRSFDASTTIPVEDIKRTPALLGEKDPLKTIQLLPGISRGTEGSAALFIRGGTPGQNLILLDDAPVYNAYHLFGFVSVINPDALKNVTFYRDGFPAKYGGRVSSIVDMQMREGNKDTLHIKGGIGILSSRLSVEGPFNNKKGTFLVSGRRSYLDLLTWPFQTHGVKQRYVFGDGSAKVSYNINNRNRVYLSSYISSDLLKSTESEDGSQGNHKSAAMLGWRNLTSTARWNFLLSPKLVLNSSFTYTYFKFETSNEVTNPGNSPEYSMTSLTSSINELSLKSNLTYFLNNQHTIEAGAHYSIRNFNPRAYKSTNSDAAISGSDIPTAINKEYSLFAEDNWRHASWLTVRYGMRLTGLTNGHYNFLEPRIGISHLLPGDWTISESYSRVNQFSHLISNTGVGLPTDLWIPSTSITPPEQSDQFALRITKAFKKSGINITVETFRKYMRNIVGYSSNASFVRIGDDVHDFRWQDNIVVGAGRSYGTEVLIEAKIKKLSAWIGYTLSWTVNEFSALNGGKPFFPYYANRHNITSLFAYNIAPRISINASWVFGSGNFLTAPAAYSTQYRMIFAGASLFPNVVPYFPGINSYKSEAYHRLDLSIQFSKQLRKFKRSWEFGVFNAYNRKNPFYYYLKETYVAQIDANVISLTKKSLFPIVPYVAWNFEF